MSDYNGYKNYNTWNIVLWIHNDERAYGILQRRAFTRKGANKKWFPTSAKVTTHSILEQCFGKAETPDGVKVGAKDIDWKEVSDAFNENL